MGARTQERADLGSVQRNRTSRWWGGVVIGSRHRDRGKRTDRGDTSPPGLVAETGWAGKSKPDPQRGIGRREGDR